MTYLHVQIWLLTTSITTHSISVKHASRRSQKLLFCHVMFCYDLDNNRFSNIKHKSVPYRRETRTSCDIWTSEMKRLKSFLCAASLVIKYKIQIHILLSRSQLNRNATQCFHVQIWSLRTMFITLYWSNMLHENPYKSCFVLFCCDLDNTPLILTPPDRTGWQIAISKSKLIRYIHTYSN